MYPGSVRTNETVYFNNRQEVKIKIEHFFNYDNFSSLLIVLNDLPIDITHALSSHIPLIELQYIQPVLYPAIKNELSSQYLKEFCRSSKIKQFENIKVTSNQYPTEHLVPAQELGVFYDKYTDYVFDRICKMAGVEVNDQVH